MRKGLLKPGAFLLGLVLVFFGLCAFVLIGILPQANTPGGDIANAKLLGSIGGGMIGLGAFAMVLGLIKRFKP